MSLPDIGTLLRENTYPGRGIVIGKSGDGAHAFIAYFIMGRSQNSRNRVFTPKGEGIITEAFDPSLMADPSLIIYTPVAKAGDVTIVTNGDQTDTVRDCLLRGGTFEEALRTRTFEPDAPNYTPRISGVAAVEGGALSYKLAILKSAGGDPASAERVFWEFPQPLAGRGHFLHTYKCNGDPAIPSFEGDPAAVAITGSLDAFGENIWKNLNDDNKVSLFVRSIFLGTGHEETRIYNKQTKV